MFVNHSWLSNELDVAMVGPRVDLTYEHENLGDGIGVLEELASGKHAFAQRLKQAQNPVIIVGSSSLQRADGAALFKLVTQLAESVRGAGKCAPDWRVLNVLQRVSYVTTVTNIIFI